MKSPAGAGRGAIWVVDMPQMIVAQIASGNGDMLRINA
jgi:hypothetical protein